MITAEIGKTRREWNSLDDVEEAWIAQQITERHRAGTPVCVYVRIALNGIDIGMIAGECQPGSRSSKQLNEDERKVLELWSERTRSNGHVEPGDVISFFKQLRQLI